MRQELSFIGLGRNRLKGDDWSVFIVPTAPEQHSSDHPLVSLS
jgi:hypothetical protein